MSDFYKKIKWEPTTKICYASKGLSPQASGWQSHRNKCSKEGMWFNSARQNLHYKNILVL